MANIIRRPEFYIPERLVTPERVYRNRREFIQRMGFAGGGLLAGMIAGCSRSSAADQAASGAAPAANLYPAGRNPEFNPNWRLTKESVATTYNNFYEFSTDKEEVHRLIGKFKVSPWSLEINGLIEKPMKLDARELIEMMGLEERVYRFRCVEAWAMIVPWTGFQLSKLIEKVQPKPEAKFIRFTSFNRPDEAPGFAKLKSYPWPYTEGLRMDEAMNPLVMVATGIYGKSMPKQHGAPLRIVIPWKYGYKGAKSIVKIEFINTQPATLWQTLAPDEYPFESNVNPDVPHPRWSQATERMIDTDDRVPTKIYNGYGSYVEKLYKRV